MSSRLSREQNLLYRKIDEILFYIWDPIGVAPEPWARDEYDNYLPQVFKLAIENDEPQPIAQYLLNITKVEMGIPSTMKHCMKTAELILSTKTYIDEMLSINPT